MEWLEKIAPLLFVLGLVVTCLNFALNAQDRRRNGPVHPPIEPDDLLFVEKRASGVSERNWSTRIGGASNALEVMVSRQGLVIQPNTVIRWLMRRNFNDLEHYIPHESVIRVEADRPSDRKRVRVEFRDADGTERSIVLYLEYSAQFLSVMSRAASGRPA